MSVQMRVLFCNLLKYPSGDAGSIRVEKLAKMIELLGDSTRVAGYGKATNREKLIHNGICYTSLRYGCDRLFDKILSRTMYWVRLKRMLTSFEPQAVVMDDLGLVNTILLKNYCKRNGVLLIHDSVEWYSPEQFRFGKWSFGYIKKDILNRYLIDRSCKVIAISRYLEDYFVSKGIDTVRIPIVISEDDLVREKRCSSEKTVFTYAGQPGKKDYLSVMLEAFARLREDERAKAVFHIVGCNKEQMIAAGIRSELLDELEDILVIHGRISHAEVLELLKTTDFTLLIRDANQRYAKAGFPSKVVESLANATPVLCNYSSDLAMYLKDGENAIIARDHSPDAVAEALRKAIGLTQGEKETLSRQALECAQECFDMTLYLGEMERILEKNKA